MRKIQFRAWDKKNKKLVVVMTLTRAEQSKLTLIRSSIENEMSEAVLTDNLEFMQYTGLKDKNGKEIYEGDIIKGADVSDDETIGVVKFTNGAFEVCDFSDEITLYYDECRFYEDWEVIGNLFENPELLNEENNNK